MEPHTHVVTTTNPAPTGPNSRVRLGETVIAIIQVQPQTVSNNQEVPRVN